MTRAGKVLKREAYAKTITVETRGQVADDAKLDYVDVKYGETTNFAQDGVRLTKYGNRAVRINMRTGGYDPGESVSFGSSSVDGHLANDAGEVANANDFGVRLVVADDPRGTTNREKDWQTPGACAKRSRSIPIRDSVMVSDGDKGVIQGAQVVTANSDGQRRGKSPLDAGAPSGRTGRARRQPRRARSQALTTPSRRRAARHSPDDGPRDVHCWRR